jgi:glycosyltransferase involved in cell wall biosynthesis
MSNSSNDRPTIVMSSLAWFGEVPGGSLRVSSELAEYAVQCGYRCVFICSSEDARTPNPRVINGVELHCYPRRSHGGLTPWAMWDHVRQTERLTRSVMRTGDVVAINGGWPLQYAGTLRGSRGRAVHRSYVVFSPFAAELRSNVEQGRESLKRQLAGAAAHWLERSNIRVSDVVLPMSGFTRRILIDEFGAGIAHKLQVAPGWVDLRNFAPADDRTTLKREFDPAWADRPLFLCLRRLEARMGIDTLIRAAARLKNAGQDFTVAIGGGGSLAESLRRLASDLGVGDVVQFLGRVPEDKLARLYASADCFVLPTRALECFGLIVLESFATRTPVIGSRAGAIPELVDLQGPGWSFDVDNDEELAELMRRVIRGELKPTRNLREIAERYSSRAIMPRWLAAILGPHADSELKRQAAQGMDGLSTGPSGMLSPGHSVVG